MLRQIRSGEGWRVGWDPNAKEFCALLAGAHWSIELTQVEFEAFCHAAKQLKSTMVDMAGQLMDEEQLTCEQETENIWLEVEGFPHSYGLRFMLRTGRLGEGEWPASAVPPLLAALEELAQISGSVE
ncbi:MAG: DUF1818 family protein [Cyanobacteria bacterium J06643_4]